MTNPLFDRLFAVHDGSEDPFLILPDGSALGYDAFLRRSARFANVLHDLGLRAGDRLVVQVAKSPDALALFAASAQAGVVFLPLNTAYTAREVAYFLGDSGAGLLICDPGDADGLAPVSDAAGARLETLDAAGGGSFASRAGAQPDGFRTVPRDGGDLAALLYTSGTTGRSKGAMLSQDNLLSNAETLRDLWRFGPGDVLLHALPVFHTHGLFVATNITLLAGGAMVLLPKFDPDAMIAHLPRATTMMGVPTFYTRLLDDPRFDAELTRHMRLFVSGSAPLLPETHDSFAARTGHRILERYGMTETNMNTSNPYDGDRRAGTVGRPLPGVDLRVTDPDTGAPVAAGDVGMIEVRGPNVFQGYWRMPEKTAEELRSDGFFITGDLGRIDGDGYLSIVGRGKDVIISGGYNIYPREIEEVLDARPGVLESAVIGAPHPDLGEAAVALLVASPGGPPDPDAIRAALSGTLARFKHPRRIEIVEALPRNTMGKVQKATLRETWRDAFAG